MDRTNIVSYLQETADEKQKHLIASLYIDTVKSQLPERVFDHIQKVLKVEARRCTDAIRDHEDALQEMDFPQWATKEPLSLSAKHKL